MASHRPALACKYLRFVYICVRVYLCRYCLPTTAPNLSSTLAPLKLAISPLLWSRHKPDCFDSYSTGARTLNGVALHGRLAVVLVPYQHARP